MTGKTMTKEELDAIHHSVRKLRSAIQEKFGTIEFIKLRSNQRGYFAITSRNGCHNFILINRTEDGHEFKVLHTEMK